MIPGKIALRHIVVAVALTASFAGPIQGQESPAKRVAAIVGELARHEMTEDRILRLAMHDG